MPPIDPIQSSTTPQYAVPADVSPVAEPKPADAKAAQPDSAAAKPALDATPVAKGDPADFRLVIEAAADKGRFVYTIIDRRSGEVVKQTPQEDAETLAKSHRYAAGDVYRGFA